MKTIAAVNKYYIRAHSIRGATLISTLLCLFCAVCTGVRAQEAQTQTAGSYMRLPAGEPMPGAPQGARLARSTARQSSRRTARTKTTVLPWGPAQNGLAPTVTGGSYALLTQLQQQNVLLDAELKIKRKEEELYQLQRHRSESASRGGGGSSGEESLAALAAIGGQPRVLLVEGKPGAIRAMISLPDGGTVLAKTGDYVPQVGTVVAISTNTVMVRTAGNKLTAVPFWSSLDASVNAQQTTNGALPPPIPTRAPGAFGPQNGSSEFSQNNPSQANGGR